MWGARADQTYDRRLLRFTAPDLLIIDDLGQRPLQHDEPLDVYEVIRQRYERGALIIASNRAVDEWDPLVRDELLASAAVDRILHHSHVFVMEGERRSVRNTAYKREIRSAGECWPSRHSRRHVLFARLDPAALAYSIKARLILLMFSGSVERLTGLSCSPKPQKARQELESAR